MIVLAYLATIVAANALVIYVGPVPVGFGLVAPAGVYAAGLCLTLRDAVHERHGATGALAAIAAGTLLSAGLSPRIALASGTAFLVSECLDLLVYVPLRRRGLLTAVVVSNLVGLVADSWLFLWLIGAPEYLAGQIVGKLWATLAPVIFYAFLRRHARAG